MADTWHHIYIVTHIHMMDSIFFALEQPFFLRSLLIVIVLAIVFPLYGNLVVVRQEANIAHTFAHIWLLGVAIWLRFDRSIELSILWSVIVTVVFLYLLWLKDAQNQIAHNEIWAQLWLVWAILLVSQMTWYRADITSYLFGDILLLGQQDIYFILSITITCIVLYIFWWRKWFAISLHKSLAKSKNISVTWWYLLYLIALGLLIGGAMKIIWVLLVSAFLILPSNIWKLLAANTRQRNIISIVACCSLSIIALFVSWHRDMPSWASIVWCMIMTYLSIITIQSFIRK